MYIFGMYATKQKMELMSHFHLFRENCLSTISAPVVLYMYMSPRDHKYLMQKKAHTKKYPYMARFTESESEQSRGKWGNMAPFMRQWVNMAWLRGISMARLNESGSIWHNFKENVDQIQH